MFGLNIEWINGQGVFDTVLAQSWCSLKISMTDISIEIACSPFPLVEWIVDNWWMMLYEKSHAVCPIARQHTCTFSNVEWLQRHNIFTCREGMPYPDLAIFAADKQNEYVYVQWIEHADSMNNHIELIQTARLQDILRHFVNEVLARLADIHDERLEIVKENWQAINESMIHDLHRCIYIGSQGLDPYAS